MRYNILESKIGTHAKCTSTSELDSFSLFQWKFEKFELVHIDTYGSGEYIGWIIKYIREFSE